MRAAFARRAIRCASTQSINPSTGVLLAEYPLWSDTQAAAAAEGSAKAFASWKHSSFAERSNYLLNAANILRARKPELAQLIAVEMGKPLFEAEGEIEKCAAVCEYYSEFAEEFLQPRSIGTDDAGKAPLPGTKHQVWYQPLGAVLIIMPWNFPFWQVFRQASTALSAGNTMLLKHAPNVFGCAEAIESIFLEAGFPKGVFQNVPISGPQASDLISHHDVKAVALTGSTPVGALVGAAAGKNIKPQVLELGGSDPYIVLEDADLDAAATACVGSRLMNCGQSCVGAKRFIVVDSVYDEFAAKFVAKMQAYTPGDPLAAGATLGPMVHKAAQTNIHAQVQKSVAAGAELLLGGVLPEGPGSFYPPTVLSEVGPECPAYREEFFGPVASLLRAKDEAEAVAIANDTDFGLGAGVFTRDEARGERVAAQLDAGLVFVNDCVKSHQALPFGGIKRSGVGRECSDVGIRTFVNIKTVVVR